MILSNEIDKFMKNGISIPCMYSQHTVIFVCLACFDIALHIIFVGHNANRKNKQTKNKNKKTKKTKKQKTNKKQTKQQHQKTNKQK